MAGFLHCRLLPLLTVSWMLGSAEPNRAAAPDDFADWPKSWVDSYHRFESFRAESIRQFPGAHLELLSDGQIVHRLPMPEKELTLDFYKEGGEMLGMSMNRQLFGNGREEIFPPGRYAAVLKSSGMLGYQYHYPIVWFEVSTSDPDGKDSAPNSGRVVRMLANPQPDESVWPNERILRFFDFHVFPRKTNPNDIREANGKVTPSVKLGVNNQGIITRKPLAAPLEKLLLWRIYFNGKLIEERSAGEQLRYDADRGVGTYQVLLGIMGPAGFMPVSNFLEFPLFSEKSGDRVVFPPVTNPTGFPDFLLEIFSPEEITEMVNTPLPGEEDPYYNRRAIYVMGAPSHFGDPEKERLFWLWETWGWELNAAQRGAGGSLGEIEGRP